MTTFFSNRTIKRFFFGAVSSPTFFIMSIKASGDEASLALGIAFFEVVIDVVAGVATGTSVGTDDSIRGAVSFGGAVPKDEVESTSFPQDARICSELSTSFHLNAPTIPMKTALPAKKFATTADDPDDTVVDTTADPDAAVTVVAFAAEIIMLVVASVSPNEGSSSKGTPNDIAVATRAFSGSGENANVVDNNNNN